MFVGILADSRGVIVDTYPAQESPELAMEDFLRRSEAWHQFTVEPESPLVFSRWAISSDFVTFYVSIRKV